MWVNSESTKPCGSLNDCKYAFDHFFCFSQPALSNLLDSSQEKCPYWLTSLNEFFYHEINQNYSDILVRFFGCRKNCEKNNKCYHSLSILHCTIWMKKKMKHIMFRFFFIWLIFIFLHKGYAWSCKHRQIKFIFQIGSILRGEV